MLTRSGDDQPKRNAAGDRAGGQPDSHDEVELDDIAEAENNQGQRRQDEA
jgi:hypothetical protein